MKSSSLSAAKTWVRSGNGIGASLLRRAVLRQLGRLRHGQLVVRDGDERLLFGQAGALLHAEIDVLDRTFTVITDIAKKAVCRYKSEGAAVVKRQNIYDSPKSGWEITLNLSE